MRRPKDGRRTFRQRRISQLLHRQAFPRTWVRYDASTPGLDTWKPLEPPVLRGRDWDWAVIDDPSDPA